MRPGPKPGQERISPLYFAPKEEKLRPERIIPERISPERKSSAQIEALYFLGRGGGDTLYHISWCTSRVRASQKKSCAPVMLACIARIAACAAMVKCANTVDPQTE